MAVPERDYPYLFRILHWVITAASGVLIVSGFGISAASHTLPFLWPKWYPDWLPSGPLPLWHLAAAPVLVAAWIIAVAVYVRGSLRGARGALRTIANIPLLFAVGLSILTAPALLFPGVPDAVYRAARILHAASGLALVPLSLLVHIVLAFARHPGLLIASFDPFRRARWVPLALWLPAPIIAACLILQGHPLLPIARDLVAKRIAQGEADIERLPWDTAPPLEIALANGVGFDGGRTRVTLRALHDGNEVFVLAEWDDPKEDRRYMPWMRTGDGWDHLMTDEDDESVHYEDKFSLVFPPRGDRLFRWFGCAAQCHLGGGRAYGYKASPSIIDVWHWKSTRTDPVGQSDDKYWYVADPENSDVGRYGDPCESGGYKKNFAKGGTAPLRLPADAEAIRLGGLLADRSVEYTDERAGMIAPGAEIPGIIVAPFAGDRGDIRNIARHEDGRWRLHLRRRLATGSPYDVEFRPGLAYDFGCAAFDCTSKRHAYSHRVYRLLLEE
ncbi:MAG: hypothetical protein JXP34_03415 [Planctomycetes bacterium]|nr:hypothetical protein [Planctomycetota bacterium]